MEMKLAEWAHDGNNGNQTVETIILQWLSYGFKNLCFDRKEGVAVKLRMTILQTKL